MFELTIKGEVYQFNFGMGFLREINKKISTPVDGLKDVNIGLQYIVASVIDGDPEALVDLLEVANKGFSPRVSRNLLDSYIDDAETDIDDLFKTVIDFLKNANATKKAVETILEAVEKQKAKEQANQN